VNLIRKSQAAKPIKIGEPFLAVQTANQGHGASAFTPNPFRNSSNAPIYVSEDGGNTWILNAITPVRG